MWGLARHSSVRTIVTAATAVVVVLATGTTLYMAGLTTQLRTITSEVAAAIESVRLAESAEIALLVHERSADPVNRAHHEESLHSLLTRARGHVTTDSEREVLQRTELEVARYLAAERDDPQRAELLQRAFASAEQLVQINIEQSQDVVRQGQRLDRTAQIVCWTTIGVMVPIVAVLLWWVRTRAFRPLLGLADAMQRFAAGQRHALAHECGPVEVREMARRFNEMASELARQRERQIAFLAGVAHDLRNPLAPLRSAATLLERSTDPAQVASIAAILRRQVDQLDRMVSDLLDVTRLDAGEFQLELARCDMRSTARAVVSLFQAAATAHEIVLVAPGEPLWVHVDAHRIEQVLSNLVGNAIKYSPGGGRVTVRVQRDGERAQMLVTDQGMGIPPHEQARIFEPFHRAKLAVASTLTGAGLGLFIARRLVEAHGGRLDLVDSGPEGSTFAVSLPLADRRTARPAMRAAGEHDEAQPAPVR